MPELPEVEVIRRGLKTRLPGRRITGFRTSGKKMRLPLPRKLLAERVVGELITAVDRRAKFLLIRQANTSILVIHLGMSGRLAFSPSSVPKKKHDHFCLQLDDGTELRFNDARRFGSIQVFWPGDKIESGLFARLGPEPFAEAFSAAYLMETAIRCSRPLKNFLMDNRVVVGIGNIYASEILFRAGILPATPVKCLNTVQWRQVIEASRSILAKAIDSGGTTINDFLDTNGSTGYFQLELAVYGRGSQPCRICTKPILRTVMAGRATYYCPGCQQ